ncbi:MAG TPA: hypothetical protein DEG06_11810, partial [Lachnospiraceae bacterium]|nr:hypothetical protein [Lachnospiraceae bacterium]
GRERSTLNTFLYMLRTNAMLISEEGMKNDYPRLWEQKEALAALRYNEISEEKFLEAEKVLRQAA